jgi:Ran GTPase-activating protein 1
MALNVTYPYSLRTLDLRGGRGALSKEKAEEMVAQVTSGGTVDYQRIIMSTWALSADSAAVLAEAMLKMPALESVVMADIIAGRPEAEGLAVYHALGKALNEIQLKELDLSDNAVGPKGVEACRSFLAAQRTLERLYFCNCGISAEAARSIADIVLGTTPTSFRLVHFHNNMSGSGGAIAIADIISASPHLEDFRFTSSRGRAEGGIALVKAVRSAVKLLHLNLHDNVFTSAPASELAESLKHLQHLQTLDLGDTLLKDEGMMIVARGLVEGACRATLQTLDVAANEISRKGAVGLAQALRKLPALRTLRIEENEMGDAGAFAVARALLARKKTLAGAEDALESISMSACELSDRGAVAIATAAARSCSKLTTLDLSDNEVSGPAWRRIKQVLAEGVAGGKVVLKGPEDDEDDDEDADEEELDVEAELAKVVAAEEEPAPAPEAVAAAAAASASPSVDDQVGDLLSKLEL